MTGTVDGHGRARVPITVRHPHHAALVVVEAWIDTGFTGELLLLPSHVAALGLPPSGNAAGVLANGSRVWTPAHRCLVEWFGNLRPVDALVAPARLPLIGVGLLEDLVLTIDYPARTLTLLPSATP